MGGYGSGRWGWRAKEDTDGLLRLDVRWLARQGYLDASTAGTYPVAWSRGDRLAGDVLVRYDAARRAGARLPRPRARRRAVGARPGAGAPRAHALPLRRRAGLVPLPALPEPAGGAAQRGRAVPLPRLPRARL